MLRWGAPIRVTEPGLNFKIPYVDSRHTVELRERAFTKTYELASRDPMELNVTVALNWAVNKQHVIQMYNQFGHLEQFEQRIIATRLPDAVKAVVSRFAVNELLTKRNELRDQARAAALAVIPQQIITITGFAVTNVEFPKAYTQQIAAVQVAREAANAQEQELRKQNFKAQEVFNTAKAQADATKAQADAEAYSITIKGKAQLDIQERQAAILKSNPLLVDWERAVRLVPGVLPHTFVGGDGSAALHVPARSDPARQQEVRRIPGRDRRSRRRPRPRFFTAALWLPRPPPAGSARVPLGCSQRKRREGSCARSIFGH